MIVAMSLLGPVGTVRPAVDFGCTYSMVSNSQDLLDVWNNFARVIRKAGFRKADITAAFELAGDAEIIEVWVTESSRPYLNSAKYTRVF